MVYKRNKILYIFRDYFRVLALPGIILAVLIIISYFFSTPSFPVFQVALLAFILLLLVLITGRILSGFTDEIEFSEKEITVTKKKKKIEFPVKSATIYEYRTDSAEKRLWEGVRINRDKFSIHTAWKYEFPAPDWEDIKRELKKRVKII